MPFEFRGTPIEGLLIIQPKVFYDRRGFFIETYRHTVFEKNNIQGHFVQDNQSRSKKGTIRGLHYQINPYCQCKLVWCVRGSVWDVAVDLRKNSKTYGQWYGLELNGRKKTMFWMPEGFAHGFASLTDNADLIYKTTREYNRDSERSIIWNDPFIGIKWPLNNPILSEKDLLNPLLSNIPEKERML
jgi:dTDP-4-dehydrorhamnose 3,5-epimerase